MTTLLRRSNAPSFTESFQNFMDRLFGEVSFPTLSDADINLPATDISENEKFYCITTELPGVKKDDIHIAMQDGILTIEAEMHSESTEEKNTFLRKERKHGRQMRRFTVGPQADENKVDAHFENGVLRVTIEKLASAISSKAKAIPVK